MMRSLHSGVALLPAGLALLMSSGAAQAQDVGPIDFRVGDSNNQVGSLGFNPEQRGGFYPNSADLYITGNVTGGRSFQAFSPVRSAYSLGLRLPSDRLSDFERDSVNLDDVLSGRTPDVASPFFSRQTVTTNLPTLNAGLAPTDAAQGPALYNLPMQTRSDLLFQYTPAPTGLDSAVPGNVQAAPGQLSFPSVLSQSQFRPPIATFGLPGATSVTGSPLGQYQVPSVPGQFVDPRTGTQLFTPGASAGTSNWYDQVSQRAPASAPDLRAMLGGEPSANPDASAGQSASPQDQAGTSTTADSPSATVIQALGNLGAQPNPSVPQAGVGAADAQSSTTSPPLKLPASPAYDDIEATQKQISELRAQAEKTQAALDVAPSLSREYEASVSAVRPTDSTPRRLSTPTMTASVEVYLRQAEEQVRQGNYYQAKHLYERAAVLDRRNAEIWIGEAHAMLGAGEYYSAVLKLSRAVEVFPASMYAPRDLRKLLVNQDVLDRRRADLEQRLTQVEDTRFRFLLGYAEYFSGLTEMGLKDLRQAAAAAEPNSGIARLPDLLSQSPVAAPAGSPPPH